MFMGFGFSYWGMVVYALIFIGCYFLWATRRRADDQEGEV